MITNLLLVQPLLYYAQTFLSSLLRIMAAYGNIYKDDEQKKKAFTLFPDNYRALKATRQNKSLNENQAAFSSSLQAKVRRSYAENKQCSPNKSQLICRLEVANSQALHSKLLMSLYWSPSAAQWEPVAIFFSNTAK